MNTRKIRLTEEEVSAIKAAVHSLDNKAKIYLFGSRTNPKARGGDIDLLIFSEILKADSKRKILQKMFENIEEQRIDLVIAQDLSDPFVQLVFTEAVQL